ncbi:hypothetical protein EYF80_066004 [Liparis tanakae]|uniref:Uncharacterized protein n=1 Tax=Liparis tanakae TaxID=230148 RepID=A0A4Z2E518_9TELE|nr:hypothetical protein EYF80_066004 [Liparis tanakae]
MPSMCSADVAPVLEDAVGAEDSPSRSASGVASGPERRFLSDGAASTRTWRAASSQTLSGSSV